MAFADTLRRSSWLGPAAAGLVCCAAMASLPPTSAAPPREVREVTVMARQYGYLPNRIFARPGEVLRLRLASRDVVHGFYLEGHDLEAEIRPGKLGFKYRHPSVGGPFVEAEEVEVTVGRPGKYRYRCSVTCGTLHPFMQGELVVRPNRPYHAGVAGALAIGMVSLLGLMLGGGGGTTAGIRPGRRIDLLQRIPPLRRLVTQRWFQFALVVPNLLVLAFFILAGAFGSPIGNRNIIVTIVWIFWWFILITALVPLGGRAWCAMCPVPFVGEWFARRRLVGVQHEAERSSSLRTGSLNRRWPRRLSGLWVQNILFLTVCSISTILVTRPALTALVLGGMVLAALAVHAGYQRRSFCRYLCPLNGWMSVYAMTAMVEVRPRDEDVCSDCRDHACAAGSDRAWACPWLLNPSKLERNNYCGLCMECVKACPNGNLTLKARPFCSDRRLHGYDEAWMALIMITLVVAYTVTLLGPWGTIKAWANVTEVGNWRGFAVHTAVVWLAALVVLPGIWHLLARLGRRLSGSLEVPTRELFIRYAYMLVPLGLLAWAAFSFPLLMVNHSHITASLSDPLGWGWNLFGTADALWHPLRPEIIPFLQIPLVLLGLALALSTGGSIARELFPDRRTALRSLLPHGVLCTGLTILLLRLFVG